MQNGLDIGQIYILAQLCWVSLHEQPEFDPEDCRKLEQKQLIYRDMVGAWRVTPKGRLAGALGRYQ